MKTYRLADFEHYNPERFSTKLVCAEPHMKCVLVNLMAGQELPNHPHTGYDVMLVPQKGQAVLTVNQEQQVTLEVGSIYSQPGGPSLQIKNNDSQSFETLVILVPASGP